MCIAIWLSSYELFFCFTWCLLDSFLHLQSVGGTPGYWQDGPTRVSGPSVGVAIIADIPEPLSLCLHNLFALCVSSSRGAARACSRASSVPRGHEKQLQGLLKQSLKSHTLSLLDQSKLQGTIYMLYTRSR